MSLDQNTVTADDIGFTALSRGHVEAAAALTGKPIHDLQGPSSIYSAIAAFQHRLERGDADRLPFGLARIDRATRGVEPGELAVFLGRTASLKTMHAINHIRHVVTKRPDLAVLLVEYGDATRTVGAAPAADGIQPQRRSARHGNRGGHHQPRSVL